MADDAGFLNRWSRRKLDVQQGKPVPAEPAAAVPAAAPVVQAPAAAAPAEQGPPPPTLQDTQSLTPQSDFKPFMAQGVAPEVKNAAMKKLFADPHFNVMDGLDVYIDDYSKPDPLPAAMLRQLASAKFLALFDDEEEKKGSEGQDARPLPRDDADAPAGEAVAQSDLCKPLPSPPDSPTLPASQPDDAHPDLRLQPDHAAVGRTPRPGPQ